ncbi:UNVERIFIED_CONTAM: class C sortase [Microbacterium sp. SLM126]
MTITAAPPAPESSGTARPTPARRPRWGWSQTVVMVVAILGVAVLAYPSAASWMSAWRHDTDVDGYVRSIENLPAEEGRELLEEARQYNEHLPAGPLRDPYALGADGQQTAVGDGSDAYFATLDVPGTEAMARIRIPTIDVDLPIFHGTSDATLARGIGHLFGSALPVGGIGTHAVLTGHSGVVEATLFDDIPELVVGDTIVITVLGEDLYYEVDQTITVLPDETEALRQDPAKDYLSLVTCTPTGVNSHRLLVRAERVDAPTGDENETAVVADDSPAAGFPWWILALIAVPVVTFIVIRPRATPARRRRPQGAATPAAQDVGGDPRRADD